MPFSTGSGGTPLSLTAQAGSRPVLGAPGCAHHVTLDASVSFGGPNNPTPITLNVPNNDAFLGYTIYVQGATLTPAANTLGV
ncbi:MAG: hypothetical protein IPK26_09865 [Planctomycetes bacterium]|nr:hypothetical protein [Planctomycetota bacterium]